MPKASEMKSGAMRPLENRPVGFPLKKSRPYGSKLLLAMVGMKLLLPESTEESPNTIIEGTLALLDVEKCTKISIMKSHRAYPFPPILLFLAINWVLLGGEDG